jgi:hypothetical protein
MWLQHAACQSAVCYAAAGGGHAAAVPLAHGCLGCFHVVNKDALSEDGKADRGGNQFKHGKGGVIMAGFRLGLVTQCSQHKPAYMLVGLFCRCLCLPQHKETKCVRTKEFELLHSTPPREISAEIPVHNLEQLNTPLHSV